MSREQSYPQWRMRNLDVDLDNFPHDPFHWLRPKRRQGLEPWRPGLFLTDGSTPLPGCDKSPHYDGAERIVPAGDIIHIIRATDAAIYKMMGE